MTGLIVAVSVLGTALVGAVVVGVMKIRQLEKTLLMVEKNLHTTADCLLTYMTHPEQIDVVEDYTAKSSSADWDFPNSEGGF